MYLWTFSHNDFLRIILFDKFGKCTCFADAIRCTLIETWTTGNVRALGVLGIFGPLYSVAVMMYF